MKQFIIPYIMFKDSLEAANYYKEIFDGEIVYIMRGKEMPKCSKDKLEDIMHLELEFNKNKIYMADGEKAHGNNMYILLDYEDLDKMTQAYKNMREGSKVIQELHKTFWGAIFGTIKDKYKITWEFHYTVIEE